MDILLEDDEVLKLREEHILLLVMIEARLKHLMRTGADSLDGLKAIVESSHASEGTIRNALGGRAHLGDEAWLRIERLEGTDLRKKWLKALGKHYAQAEERTIRAR